MNETATQQALPLALWARIWSPVTEEQEREDAWQALGLPGKFADISTEYWSTFHVGSPQPAAPLLLSVMLGKEANSMRESWLRVISYLGLEWDEVHLPPDQLGVACEIVAVAVTREESVLVAELKNRYLLPWCQAASASIKEGGLKNIVLAFQECVTSTVG